MRREIKALIDKDDDDFIDRKVRNQDYASKSHAIRRAVKLLREHDEPGSRGKVD